MSLAAHAVQQGDSGKIDVPRAIRDLLCEAGVTVNGPRAFDIQVKDPRVFDQVLRKGSLGLGESYMDGYWEAQCLDECLARLLGVELNQKIYALRHLPLLVRAAGRHRVL